MLRTESQNQSCNSKHFYPILFRKVYINLRWLKLWNSYLGRTLLLNRLDVDCDDNVIPGRFGKLNRDVDPIPNIGLALFNLPLAMRTAFGIPLNSGFPVSTGPE